MIIYKIDSIISYIVSLLIKKIHLPCFVLVKTVVYPYIHMTGVTLLELAVCRTDVTGYPQFVSAIYYH